MKKKIFDLLLGVLFGILVLVSVQLVLADNRVKASYLVFANFESLAAGSSSDSYICSSGGPGSKSCSTSASGSIKTGGLGTSCSVECNSGYYACCNAFQNKCQCRLAKSEKTEKEIQ